MYDIRQAVDAAAQQRVLHPLVLGAVATTLAAAARLQGQLTLMVQEEDVGAAGQQHSKQQQQYPALQELAAGLGDTLPHLLQAIERCIQVRYKSRSSRNLNLLFFPSTMPRIHAATTRCCPAALQPREGRILDNASPALAAVREARRTNRAELRALMDSWARQMHLAGVSERAQVVVRRDRLCLPVRSGRQGELPKGSVTLATSTTGSTLYMEPQVGGQSRCGGWEESFVHVDAAIIGIG